VAFYFPLLTRESAVLRDLDREWIFGFFYVPSDWNHTRRREIDTTSDRSIFTCGAYVHVRTYELTYVQRELVTRSLLRYARTTPKSGADLGWTVLFYCSYDLRDRWLQVGIWIFEEKCKCHANTRALVNDKM